MSTPTPEETQDGLPGLEQRLARAETLLSLYEQLISQLPIGIMMWQLEDPADNGSFRLIAANPAMQVASGFDVAAEAGNPMPRSSRRRSRAAWPRSMPMSHAAARRATSAR